MISPLAIRRWMAYRSRAPSATSPATSATEARPILALGGRPRANPACPRPHVPCQPHPPPRGAAPQCLSWRSCTTSAPSSSSFTTTLCAPLRVPTRALRKHTRLARLRELLKRCVCSRTRTRLRTACSRSSTTGTLSIVRGRPTIHRGACLVAAPPLAAPIGAGCSLSPPAEVPATPSERAPYRRSQRKCSRHSR